MQYIAKELPGDTQHVDTCWTLDMINITEADGTMTLKGYKSLESKLKGAKSAHSKTIQVNLAMLPTWQAFQRDLLTYLLERSEFHGGTVNDI